MDKIEDLQAAVAAGEVSLTGVAIVDIEAAIGVANEAVAAGDLDAAKAALNGVKAAQDAARRLASVQAAIAAVQARVDTAKEAGEEAIGDLTVAEVEAVIASARQALEAGDVDAGKEALSTLSNDRGHQRGHGFGGVRRELPFKRGGRR